MSAEKQQYVAPQRFEVSHEGMQELNSHREPWELMKELVQNTWDEAPEATRCWVTIKAAPNEDATLILVEDDGPGFKNVEDAWTLMRHTAKRTEPTKRGRFNMGEKELISVALEAEVETVGHTVSFPRLGTRVVTPNSRTRGTVIRGTMPWSAEQREQLIARLRQFRVMECGLTVNGEEVAPREPDAVRSVILDTVLQDGPNQPMRRTRRRGDIHFLAPVNAEGQAWLYEMGIPIQKITTRWDIEVMQKVPMPPHRDTVSESYLTDIYAETLNELHERMEAEQFRDQWVKTAIEDARTSADAIRSIVKGRYGDYPLLTSPDANANLKAAEAGHQLVNPRSLSKTERQRFRDDAGLQTTHEVYGEEPPPTKDRAARNKAERAFAKWVQECAEKCGMEARVRFFEDATSKRVADCTATTDKPTIRFNLALLSEDFVKAPYGRADQLELVFHELGHAAADKPTQHGPAWGEAVAVVAARIAAG